MKGSLAVDLPADGGIGARLRMRLMTEAYLGLTELLIRHFDGSVERGLIFLILLNHSFGDFAQPERPADLRAVSINAIAQSLDRPFETVRRRVHELEAMGLCRRTVAGIVLDEAAPASFGLDAFKTEFNDVFVRLIEDLATMGVELPPALGMELLPHAVISAGIDLLLCAYEFSAPEHGDWTKLLLFVAIMTANARRITYDERLARLYADNDTMPPAQARVAVPAIALSRTLHLPYATIRRHIDQMVSDGRLLRTDSGFLCTEEAVQRPALLDSSVMIGRRMVSVLARLAARGFPFDAPARAYVRGRPPLLSFGTDA